jgi:hypothetical protein
MRAIFLLFFLLLKELTRREIKEYKKDFHLHFYAATQYIIITFWVVKRYRYIPVLNLSLNIFTLAELRFLCVNILNLSSSLRFPFES